MTEAARSPAARAALVLWTALAFALVTGVLHVLINVWRHVVQGGFIWTSREYVWMMPLGYTVLFLAVAAVLVPLALAAPRQVGPRVVGFAFATLGALALLLLVPGLHHLAALALAAGIGTRAASWLARETPRRVRAMRLVAGGLAAAVAVVAVARWQSRLAAERRAIASLPAPPADAPNVLLIILDTVRAASMSFQGYARATTPAMARRAAEGAVFEHAFSTAPWTLPSHAGAFTGRYPSGLSADWREPLDGEAPTLAEVFAAAGYRTAGFTANHLYTSYESGLARGFQRYEDYQRTAKQMLLSTSLTQTRLFWQLLHGAGVADRLMALARMNLRADPMWVDDRKLAPVVSRQFLDWQATLGARPFFAFVNIYDAHLPYDPPGPWRERFSPTPTPLDLYDASIAFLDESLGAMLDELARRGALDRTIVVITSDHGEAFGEHGLHGHGSSLYLPELHVPLVVRYPARVPGRTRIDAPVTIRDIPATVLDLARLPTTAPFPGSSLASTWEGEGEPARGSAVIEEVSAGINTAPHEPVSRGAMRSLIDSTHHYIRNGDGVEELYAWRSDSGEATNLAARPEARDAVARITGALRRALGR